MTFLVESAGQRLALDWHRLHPLVRRAGLWTRIRRVRRRLLSRKCLGGVSLERRPHVIGATTAGLLIHTLDRRSQEAAFLHRAAVVRRCPGARPSGLTTHLPPLPTSDSLRSVSSLPETPPDTGQFTSFDFAQTRMASQLHKLDLVGGKQALDVACAAHGILPSLCDLVRELAMQARGCPRATMRLPGHMRATPLVEARPKCGRVVMG